jgi:hypothetical protein
MECKDRLDILQKTLQESYQNCSAESFIESVKTAHSDSLPESMDYELVFRGILDDIIAKIAVDEVRY